MAGRLEAKAFSARQVAGEGTDTVPDAANIAGQPSAGRFSGEEAAGVPQHHVGSDIRALRKSRGLTLNELCDALGRSIGWLSQVERGQTNPSIPDLKALAAHFAVPVSFFFRNADAPADERGWIVRAHSRAAMGSPEDGLTEELLSPDLGGDFEMIRSVFAPGATREVMVARDTQDGGYVISGELEMTIGGQTYVLRAGDSFQFDRQPYGWINRGDKPAEVIWIISPPTY